MFAVLLVAMSLSSAFALRPAARPLGQPLQRSGRSPSLQLAEKWQDAPIFDESIPDPVYDEPSPYKGRVPYGFSNYAETLNGRAAMMAFLVLFLQESIVGKGVLQQYGLPYDEGAVLPLDNGGLTLPPVVGLVIATAITVFLLYVGEFLDDKLRAEPATGITKLPFGGARKE